MRCGSAPPLTRRDSRARLSHLAARRSGEGEPGLLNALAAVTSSHRFSLSRPPPPLGRPFVPLLVSPSSVPARRLRETLHVSARVPPSSFPAGLPLPSCWSHIASVPPSPSTSTERETLTHSRRRQRRRSRGHGKRRRKGAGHGGGRQREERHGGSVVLIPPQLPFPSFDAARLSFYFSHSSPSRVGQRRVALLPVPPASPISSPPAPHVALGREVHHRHVSG